MSPGWDLSLLSYPGAGKCRRAPEGLVRVCVCGGYLNILNNGSLVRAGKAMARDMPG